MICDSCKKDVDVVSSVFKEKYDEQGNLLGQVAQEYWCIPCFSNLQNDFNYSIGVDVADDTGPSK